MRRRTLALRRETLTELASDDLAGVVAAAVPTTECLYSFRVTACYMPTSPVNCP